MKDFSKIVSEKIRNDIEEIFALTFSTDGTTVTTNVNKPITMEYLLELKKQLKPEYCIKLNPYAKTNKVFEIDIDELGLGDRFYAKKMLVINPYTFLNMKLKDLIPKNIRVYD
jgi:hypothetical protein